jgi:hypothetical protein
MAQNCGREPQRKAKVAPESRAWVMIITEAQAAVEVFSCEGGIPKKTKAPAATIRVSMPPQTK